MRFTAFDGQIVEFTERMTSYPARDQVGETVPVIYDPQRFARARVLKRRLDLYSVALLWGGLGGLFLPITCLLGGLAVFIFSQLAPAG